MKIIVNENQKGILFQNGKYTKVLEPGKYHFFLHNPTVFTMNVSEEFSIPGYDLALFLKDDKLREQLVVVDVADESIVLHYKNGKFCSCLTSGRYAFWNPFDLHEFKAVDIHDPEVSEEVPKFIFEQISKKLFCRYEVEQNQKARLSVNQKFRKLLDEGTYYFWNNGSKISLDYIDTRLLQMDITGQEMLTLDKVALRINFVCRYKITDYSKILTEIEDYKEQIRVTLQLALREYIGKFRLDEILENKDRLSEFVFHKLKEKEADFYISIFDAGAKDLILPGEIREIMNTVLIAEKKAQANVITRREEVASTRSLLNTAKLMDENQTLYKLKELEHLEKICENVGNINVNGGSDLLTQLGRILKEA